MTIDEAIAKYREKAEWFKMTTNVAYVLELENIAEWLEELKELRANSCGVLQFARILKDICCVEDEDYDKAVISPKFLNDTIDILIMDFPIEVEYNKAIDDFAKWIVEHKIVDEDSIKEIIIDFNEEQLKAGEESNGF